MSRTRLSEPLASPSEVLSHGLAPEEGVAVMRSLLLSGYGAGASEAQVLTVTRERAAIGGVSTTARRARTAESTEIARGSDFGAFSRFKRGLGRAILLVAVPVVVFRVLRMYR